jgi:hypothetical protein
MRPLSMLMCGLALTAGVSPALAHDGRRFEVQVIDDQLFAQGYLSGDNPADDGGGIERPYANALHDHWANHANSQNFSATAYLPGYTLPAGGPLTGHTLDLTLIGASKWDNPPAMPAPGTIPDLVPLDSGESISVNFFDGVTLHTATTDSPGTIPLVDAIDAGGFEDIDPFHQIQDRPEGVIHVLEFVLSTSAPGVADSGSIFVVLSPDGDTMAERLHHASLLTEAHLGTPIPAPGAALGVTALASVGLRRRRA